MIAVSRRESKSLPLHASSSRLISSAVRSGTDCSGTAGGLILANGICAISSSSLEPAKELLQAAVMPRNGGRRNRLARGAIAAALGEVEQVVLHLTAPDVSDHSRVPRSD